MTIYEYLKITQPEVIRQLQGMGLLSREPEIKKKPEDLRFGEVVKLMQHDYYKRINGAIKQIYSSR